MNQRDMSMGQVPYNGSSFGTHRRPAQGKAIPHCCPGNVMMGSVKQELDNCQDEIKKTQNQLSEISQNSGKLLSLFLCNGDPRLQAMEALER